MPTFRTALTISQEYDGGSGTTITVPLTGAQVGDTVVVLHGIDYANNPNNSNGIPAMTGSGITVTTRTTLTFNTESSNCAFVAASTAVVTSASSPSFTVGSGSRDSAAAAAWAILPGQWDFVSAGTTGTSTTSSNTIDTPTLAAAAGDTWFGAYVSEYRHTGQWTLPAGTSGGVHFFGVTDQGAVGACWEDLVSGDISGGQVSGRTGTKTGTARMRSAAAIVMRPAVTSVTHDGAASFAGAGAMSVTGQATRQATATFAGAGALTVAAQQTHQVSVSLAGAGSMAAGSGVDRPAAATFAGAGAMTAGGTRIHSAAATLAGAGQLVATPGGLAQATFAGAGQMSTATQQTHQAAVSLAGAGAISVGAQSTQQITAAFTGAGAMSVAGTPVRPAEATFTGAGAMSVDGRRVHPATWIAAGEGSLTAAGIRTRPAAAVFAGSGRVQVQARQDKPGVNLSLWAVLGSGILAPLPGFAVLELSRERNAVGSVRVDYPATAPGFGYLRAAVAEDRPVEVEMWLGGSRDGALRARITQTSGDDLNGRAVWSFTGGFCEADLADGVVYPQPLPAEKGELRFDGANPGTIVLTVLQQAQARGALTGMGRDWTTTHDSSGQPWPSTVSGLKYSPKTTLLAIVQDLADKDLAEFEVVIDASGNKVLRLWAPDRRGTDRTTGADPTLFRYGRISASPLRHSTRDTITAILAIGADGLSATASDASAQARIGRRVEGTVDAGNIDNQAALTAYAQAALNAATKGQEEIRHPLTFGAGDPRPKAGYDLADRVLSERAGGTRRAVDVQQWTLTANRQRVTDGEVILNDLISSRLQRLARQLDRLGSGGAVIGTSEPPVNDNLTPAAPTGVTADSLAYQDGVDTYATVIVGWAPVTTNASGPVAPKAIAAQLILQRMQSGLTIAEDWTWSGAPSVVGAWNDTLFDEFEDSGSSDEQAWLAAFVAANSVTGTAAEDIAGYRVEYRYQTGPDTGWILGKDQPGQYVTSTTFGGVGAGIDIVIRVFAYDRDGNVSAPSAEVAITTETDNTPPPVPSVPVVTPYLGQLKIAWDGLGSVGEPMSADLDFVEVHLSTAAVFTPSAATLIDNFSTVAGERIATDLDYGVTYYARLVAVDRTTPVANRSEPSATGSGTPSKVVQIDIGPNAIGQQQIIDLEVVTAKIDNLAVNDAQFGGASVGKLEAGVLNVAVTNAGIIRTGTSGARTEQDSGGFRVYNGAGTQTIGLVPSGISWITGELRTALTGSRMIFNPGGSLPSVMRFYPTGGSSYGEMRVQTDGSGMASLEISGQGTSYGEIGVRPAEGFVRWGNNTQSYSAVSALENSLNMWGPHVQIECRHEFPAALRRILFFHRNTNGTVKANSLVQHQIGGGDYPAWQAPGANSGWIFGPSYVFASDNNALGIEIRGLNFSSNSSETLKDDIREPGRRYSDVVRAVAPKMFKFKHQSRPRPAKPGHKLPNERRDENGHPVIDERGRPVIDLVDAEWTDPQPAAPDHFFLIAEELAAVAPELVQGDLSKPDTLLISHGDLIGVLWQMNREQDAELAELRGRLDAIAGGPNPPIRPGGRP